MKLIDLKKIHQGKYLSYYVATYETEKGNIKEYEFISRDGDLSLDKFGHNKPAGVGLVAYSEDKKKVLLECEFRLATNNWVYNFPAGLIDEGEDALIAAKRELEEETGLKVVDVEAILPPSFASQGTSDEMMQIVICTCKGEIRKSCFDVEEINTKWYTKEEVRKLIEDKAYMSVRTQMFLWQWINEK